MKLAIIFFALLLAGTFAYPQSSAGRFRSGKVIGGTNATEGEFPFHVNFELLFFNTWYYYCAGVLVDDHRILTSAGVILSSHPFELRAVAGDQILYDVSANEQMRYLVDAAIHPDFDQDSRNNDLAVVTVDPPFIFNQYVQPLRLAETAFGDPQGEVVSIGFGDFDNAPGAFLQKATMDVIDRETCGASYEGYDYDVPLVTESMVCAGAPGKEICGSDLGGALLGKDGAGRQYLAGIASWGALECANYPSVFTNISPLRGWLESTLKP